MLHFPLCLESVLWMPRIEIEFEFDMIFFFGIRLALYAAFFSLGFTFNQSDRPINIVFVRLSVRSFVVSL